VLTKQEGRLQLAIRKAAVSTHTPEFSRVFEQYHGLVFRTAYRITGNAADAEDILQTIFLRLLRRDASAPAPVQEESYLRRAAVNASLDLVRSRRTAPTVPLSEALGHRPNSSAEMRDCLRRAFASLNPRAAEIFALRYFEDFTNPQIARALNMSQMLVAVTLHRARRQLQKEIRSYLGGQS
jgi:RNA polymerase sigma-70 factor (ECF subfamily)